MRLAATFKAETLSFQYYLPFTFAKNMMKQPVLKSLFGLLLLLGQSATGLPIVAETPDEALTRLLTRLQAIKRIRYDAYREVNYKSEQYRNELTGTVFVDFQSGSPLTGFRFQIEDDSQHMVYDGSTLFTLNKTQKTMQVNQQPKLGDIASLSFFYNSLVTFRNALATIVADKSILKVHSDTLVGTKTYGLLQFSLPSRTINNLGTFTNLTTTRLITYKILIDKTVGLPVQIIQSNNVAPNDYVLTRFSNYNVDNVQPEAGTWHYFAYVGDYRLTSKK